MLALAKTVIKESISLSVSKANELPMQVNSNASSDSKSQIFFLQEQKQIYFGVLPRHHLQKKKKNTSLVRHKHGGDMLC